MSESTARLALPLIAPGQAQKEVSHNEALAVLDLLVQAAVEGVAVDTPPSDPEVGQCWTVGAVPTGGWAAHAGSLAGWTAGGWRFAVAHEGMTVRIAGVGGFARYTGGVWIEGALRGNTLSLAGSQVVGARRAAIGDATGGATVDAEARTALNAVLAALRGHGLVAT